MRHSYGRGLQGIVQVPYQVGELVVVIGFTNPFSDPCGVRPGDWLLLVSRTNAGGGNYLTEYWKQVRCPGAAPVDKFFTDVEDAYAIRADCNGGPLVVSCDCTGSSMACIATEV